MINQQLIDYIKRQLQQGVSREQIKSFLMANGSQIQDIEAGFNAVNASDSSGLQSSIQTNSSNKIWKIIAGILAGAAIFGSGTYFASQTFFKSEEIPKTSKPTETVAPPEQPTPQTDSQNPEIVFADKLSSCTKYKATFKQSVTGETLEKEVMGVVNEKCSYIEQMPNGGKMQCEYTVSERIVVAQYYKDLAMAESTGTNLNVNLESGEQKTTYTINSKVVDNPLQEAINNGVCVISGY